MHNVINRVEKIFQISQCIVFLMLLVIIFDFIELISICVAIVSLLIVTFYYLYYFIKLCYNQEIKIYLIILFRLLSVLRMS